MKHIKNIYTSWSRIRDLNKPIITFDYIYYNEGNTLKAFNYNKIIFSFPSVFYPYGSNSYLKPIDSYSLTSKPYSIFFTKDCSLRLYSIYDAEFNYNNAILNIKFEELKGIDCYDTLRIFYDTETDLIAVYNLKITKFLL